MEKISFLIKLAKKGTLQEVEPSKEISEAYLQRSEESLSSAKGLLKMGNLKDSVALSYYSMYHSLIALLFAIGVKCENHAAAIILLKEVFSIDEEQISKAKSERLDKQYYIDFQINKEEVQESIKISEKFIAELHNFISNLTKEKIKEYHKKAISLFKE